jgi:hypothetical protein
MENIKEKPGPNIQTDKIWDSLVKYLDDTVIILNPDLTIKYINKSKENYDNYISCSIFESLIKENINLIETLNRLKETGNPDNCEISSGTI